MHLARRPFNHPAIQPPHGIKMYEKARSLRHLARRLKMATKAKSAANGLNCPEIPSKRSFWRRYGAPDQEAENSR